MSLLCNLTEPLLLFTCGVVCYICTKDPNPKLSEDDKVIYERHMEWFVNKNALGSSWFILIALAETFASSSSNSRDEFLFPICRRNPDGIYLNPVRAFGFAAIMFGGAIRIWAMHTLGRLFTFKLSIRPSHRLIRSGPYAWVRNPSYTGVYFLVHGCNLVALSGNAAPAFASKLPIITIPSILFSPRVLFLLTLVPLIPVHFAVLVGRIRNEEHMLGNAFGEDWSAYKRETPYRLFPWIW